MEDKKTPEEYTVISRQAIKRLKQLQSPDDWQENGDSPCAMFKCEIGDRVASKGIAKVPYSFEKVHKFLDQEESLKKINPMLLEIKILESHQSYRINYMQYSGIWPVDNREFINVYSKEVIGDKVYIGTTDCPFPYPTTKGVVRGQLIVGGYIVEKIDENTTQITYISDVDFKGSLPGMIKNTLSARQGQLASKIAAAMQKDGYQ